MKRAADALLLVLQWALVLFGVYLLVIAAHLYSMGFLDEGDALTIKAGDTYVVPIYQRLAQAISSGLLALGVGGILFYLRRLYLARRP